MKNQKGITLIALVITIIVLLILAGVSIAMLTGQNGILTQANNSKAATAKAEAVEKIKFLRKYFKDMTIIPVPRELSKTEMVHVHDSILIDDYAGNLDEWKNKGGISIRFNRNLQGKGYPVIDKLDQILEIL